MKIFPLKPLSTIDKFNNLMHIINEAAELKKAEEQVQVLGANFSKRELRSVYKNALKQLSKDSFEPKKW